MFLSKINSIRQSIPALLENNKIERNFIYVKAITFFPYIKLLQSSSIVTCTRRVITSWESFSVRFDLVSWPLQGSLLRACLGSSRRFSKNQIYVQLLARPTSFLSLLSLSLISLSIYSLHTLHRRFLINEKQKRRKLEYRSYFRSCSKRSCLRDAFGIGFSAVCALFNPFPRSR